MAVDRVAMSNTERFCVGATDDIAIVRAGLSSEVARTRKVLEGYVMAANRPPDDVLHAAAEDFVRTVELWKQAGGDWDWKEATRAE